MAPAGNNNNPALVLSEKVGVSLEQAAADLELLKKSLSASNTDQTLQLEAERDELKAEKLQLQADRAEFKAQKLEWEASKGGAGSSSSTNSELEAAKEQLKANHLQLKAKLKIAESQLKDCHDQLQAGKSELETAHKQLDEARAELEAAQSHLEAAKAQADINSAKLEAAKASLEAAKARFEAATKQLDAAKRRFEAAKSQLDSARVTLEAERSHLLDEIAALEKRVSEAEPKNAELEKDNLALNSQLEKSKAAAEELSEKMKEVSEQLEQCKKDKKTMEEVELPGLREKVIELEEQLKKCREDKKDTTENEKPNIQDQKGNNPKVFLDIAINGRRAGRVVIELHADTTPLTAENFRVLCTGEKGIGQSGKPLHYKGSMFYRVKPEEKLCQGGDITYSEDYYGGDSIYGPTFPAENLTKKHAGPGVVSMVRQGNPQISNGSQFFITTARAEEYDGRNVVFGQVVEGMEVVMEMLSAGSGASLIDECGQLN
uniref:peptidylprolyl isomerase n=1 Tax=Kalanchoe fedtschenkoi TaxID=63787 RepID=A0A7N0VBD0_KALFE